MNENKKRCAIGVDFGGTFVKMARVDEHGAIGARASFATTDLQGVPGNGSDVAVCQAVAGIARSLGLGLVAEGVETEAQRRFLMELGVPVGQGFLFAKALVADEFAKLLIAPPALALHA